MWRENLRNVFRSDIFELNTSIVQLPRDFKKYFPSIVYLRKHRKRDYYNNILKFPLGSIF